MNHIQVEIYINYEQIFPFENTQVFYNLVTNKVIKDIFLLIRNNLQIVWAWYKFNGTSYVLKDMFIQIAHFLRPLIKLFMLHINHFEELRRVSPPHSEQGESI